MKRGYIFSTAVNRSQAIYTEQVKGVNFNPNNSLQNADITSGLTIIIGAKKNELETKIESRSEACKD